MRRCDVASKNGAVMNGLQRVSCADVTGLRMLAAVLFVFGRGVRIWHGVVPVSLTHPRMTLGGGARRRRRGDPF